MMKLKLLPDGWSALGAVIVGALASIGFGLVGCVGQVVAPVAGDAAGKVLSDQAARQAATAPR